MFRGKAVLGPGLAALLAAAIGGPPAAAEEAPRGPDEAAAATGEEARPKVGLDQLLELPEGLDYGGQKRGGLTRGEWRSRFRGLRAALADERRLLEAARGELEQIAGSADAWSVGPPIPGAASSDTPLDYRLRQEIQRRKDEVERLERALRELGVQADLAGVPAEWRE